MTSDLLRALQREKLCYITTYNAAGKAGTVEIWFLWHQGKVYVSTGTQTLKVQKLRSNPQAKVAIGSRKGPAVEGTVRFADEATVRRVLPLLSRKYNHFWGPVDDFVRAHVGRGTRVLLELTPS